MKIFKTAAVWVDQLTARAIEDAIDHIDGVTKDTKFEISAGTTYVSQGGYSASNNTFSWSPKNGVTIKFIWEEEK